MNNRTLSDFFSLFFKFPNFGWGCVWASGGGLGATKTHLFGKKSGALVLAKMSSFRQKPRKKKEKWEIKKKVKKKSDNVRVFVFF